MVWKTAATATVCCVLGGGLYMGHHHQPRGSGSANTGLETTLNVFVAQPSELSMRSADVVTSAPTWMSSKVEEEAPETQESKASAEPVQTKASSAASLGDTPHYRTALGSLPYEANYQIRGPGHVPKPEEINEMDQVLDIYTKLMAEESNDIIHEVAPGQDTWVLPGRQLSPTRNHDTLVLEVGGNQYIVSVLGRWSRYIQVRNLHTGERWARRTEARDPAGDAVDNLNHVFTILVDKIDGSGGKEVWLPCGFAGDVVDGEHAIEYARIIDLDTLEVRVGPKMPYAGGACVGAALKIIPDEPEMICSFGGTQGHHNSGLFQPYTSCYDRVREKYVFPFGQLPMGLDHGSISLVPAATCNPDDPDRLLVLNYRVKCYSSERPEILAFDIPKSGWSVDELESPAHNMTQKGSWYVYHNVSYTGAADYLNCPRDASGVVSANNGREILNFGGVYYHHDEAQGWKRHQRVFDIIRSFDVCDKQWSLKGQLGTASFALQTSSSEELNMAFTCGGESLIREPWHKGNQPWCFVHHFDNATKIANRHGAPAKSGFAPGFVPGGKDSTKAQPYTADAYKRSLRDPFA